MQVRLVVMFWLFWVVFLYLEGGIGCRSCQDGRDCVQLFLWYFYLFLRRVYKLEMQLGWFLFLFWELRRIGVVRLFQFSVGFEILEFWGDFYIFELELFRVVYKLVSILCFWYCCCIILGRFRVLRRSFEKIRDEYFRKGQGVKG